MFLGGLAELWKANFMNKIWIVILVKRGFIQEPGIFYDELSAIKRMKKLLVDYNRDYDELDIFEKKLHIDKLT